MESNPMPSDSWDKLPNNENASKKAEYNVRREQALPWIPPGPKIFA